MRTRSRLLFAALVAASAIAATQAGAAIQAPSPMAGFVTELPAAADSASFLPAGDAIAVVSRSGRTVAIIGTAGREVLRSVPLSFGPVDADISADGAHVYVVGPGEAAGTTMLARVDVADGALRVLALGDAGEIIGIGLSPRGDIYLADRSASGVTGFPGDLFEKATPNEPLAVSLKDVARGALYFKAGVVDIAATDKPGLVFILHEFENSASVVDLASEKIVDQISLATQSVGPAPLVQALSARRGDSKKSPEVITSAVFGDSGGGRIVVSDLDLGFSSLEIVQTIDLSMQLAPSSSRTERMLVAADEQQNVILVGTTTSSKVVMFKRVDRTVELVGEAELPGAPVDIEVSEDGQALAFLVNGGSELVTIDQPDAWRGFFEGRTGASADVIRDIQRMLSMLGYPVGVVDGMPGRRTEAAIRLFQESIGLPATGKASVAVQDALRDVAPQGNNFEFKQQSIQSPMRR